MAKRLTESEKWKDPWFRQLSPKMKLVWLYILDQCDYCGIWEPDIDLMSLQIGFDITNDDINALVNDHKIELYGKKYIISAFLSFQYGAKQNNSKILSNCLERLDKLKQQVTLTQGLPNPYLRDKVKVKVKVKVPDDEIDGVARQKVEREVFDFEAIYENYPRKIGKSSGLKSCAKQIKTKEEYEQLLLAVKNYSAQCLLDQTEKKFIKKFNNFLKDDYWRDFIDADIPTPELSYEERMRKIAERNV